MEGNIFKEEILKDNSDLFSYKVSFEGSNVYDLEKSINQYLEEKFDDERICDFNGKMDFNLISNNEHNLEQDFDDSLISNDIIEKITTWIDVSEKEFILNFYINNEKIYAFILNEKIIKKEKNKTKEKKRGGCFWGLLKFIYYLFFYGGGLSIFLFGVVVIQGGKINMGISIISFSFILFLIPTGIKFLIRKINNKLKNK